MPGIIIPILISTGMGIASEVMKKKAADKAIKAQREGTEKARAIEKGVLPEQKAVLSPYMNVGGQAFTTLGAMMGLPNAPVGGGGAAAAPTSKVTGPMGPLTADQWNSMTPEERNIALPSPIQPLSEEALARRAANSGRPPAGMGGGPTPEMTRSGYGPAYTGPVGPAFPTDEYRDRLYGLPLGTSARTSPSGNNPNTLGQAAGMSASEQTTLLIAPTGEQQHVPVSQVDHYLSLGARRAS